MGRRRRFAALLAAAALVPSVAVAAASDFDNPASSDTSQQFTPSGNVQRQDTPNDPDYDVAERGGSTNLYDERFDLFGFPSKFTPLAIYKDGPNAGKPMVAGFNAAGAYKIERGKPGTVVAILDTGIKWDRSGLRTQVHLNRAELPKPQGSDVYDADGNGVLDVDDYASDPRVGKAKPTGQDLIRAFSDGTDADSNGYVDDIAGWDFFDDDNDPFDSSSYFAASNHGSARAGEAVERGNDGEGSIGVCPRCQYVPLRIWDTFVSDQTTFALGMIYATDIGAKVIEGADGGLYHSAFAEQASEYAYSKGVSQVFSGDDLNTGNHNYPANYSHTMLIQGTVGDTFGLGTDFGAQSASFLNQLGVPLGSNVPTLTLFRGAGTTQYGGHSSVSMIGSTGSANTGKAAGAAALVISAAKDRNPPVDLNADETREILEQTAEDVTAANGQGAGVADYATDGWDPHFGWGRVNLGAAVQVAQKGSIPPEAAIYGPDWFAPLTGSDVRITGRARARHVAGGGFHYKLEWGAGETPTSWTTAKEGDASGEVTDFGSIDLSAVRAALASYTPPLDGGAPIFAPGGPNPFAREFTVRLTVTGAGAGAGAGDIKGVDRRVFTALDDPTLKPGFPARLGTGGEAPIRYADLDGDNSPELIVPLENGTLHAYSAKVGGDLPGFPVKTDLMKQATGHDGSQGIAAVGAVAPPREPLRAVDVADLDGDGAPELITTAGRHVYVWETDGSRRPGFPQAINPAFCRPEDESQPLGHRKCGFLGSPAIARLEGPDGPRSIVAAALDGHVYAFRPDGTTVPKFPVELVDPALAPADQMRAESINSPAVGDLDGDGFDDLVIASNESYGQSPSLNTDILGQVLAQAGGTSRLYAISGRTGRYLPGWPVKLNGAIQDTLPLIGPGHDAAIATIGGAKRVIASTTGSGSIQVLRPDGSSANSAQQIGAQAYGPGSDATDRTGSLNLFESAVVGDLLGTGTPAIVKYGVTLSQAVNLLLVGQNQPYNHLINAFDATTGAPLPAYPRVTEDYQFLSSSTIARVAKSGPTNQVLAGTGLGLLHAYDGATGLDAPGFPKVTGGWLFAPAAISDDGRMAGITREGYLFQWSSDAPRCQPDAVWPEFRHDGHGSGNLDTDGTAPGTPANPKLVPVDGGKYKLTFLSPGDDRLCGTPAAYTARVAGEAVDLGGRTVTAGEQVTRTVKLPRASGTLRLGATDEAGNRGIRALVDFGGKNGSPGGNGGGGNGSGGNGNGNGGGGPNCGDTRNPRARFKGRRIRRHKIVVRGRARDRGCSGLKRIRVAISRKAHGRCRVLRRSGRLGKPRPCRERRYLRAKGKHTWKLKLRSKRLRRGRYVAHVRALDRAGNRERHRHNNRTRFRVRRRR